MTGAKYRAEVIGGQLTNDHSKVSNGHKGSAAASGAPAHRGRSAFQCAG